MTYAQRTAAAAVRARLKQDADRLRASSQRIAAELAKAIAANKPRSAKWT